MLLQAIELATWAPNGGNQQNSHFYVIVNRDTLGAIAEFRDMKMQPALERALGHKAILGA